MQSFKSFYRKIMDNPTKKTILKIGDEKKTIKSMIHLTSKNYLGEGGDYIKIYFKEDGYLLIIPGEKEVYFSNKIQGRMPGITDEMVGKKKFLTFNGKKYKLANKDDYQFVLKLIVGSPLEIEGECRFSDYFPVEGPHEFLSLGWLTYSGKRADLHCKIIDPNEIEFVKY
ncbi:hypothetical protein ACFL2C_01095 [Patescibacteria group bacterium]